MLAKFLALFALSAVLSLTVDAQVLYGTVVGTVVDSSGAVIGGATVTLTNTQTCQARSTTTHSVGVFTLSDVPGGTYSVEIGATGFQKYIQFGLEATIKVVLQTRSR